MVAAVCAVQKVRDLGPEPQIEHLNQLLMQKREQLARIGPSLGVASRGLNMRLH
ncbi:hypothetical protein ACVIIV_002967 [Bradyrhizobium sp. USDA 4354]